MALLFTISLGILYFSGFYLLFQKSLMRNLVGLLILSNAINLLIFTAGGTKRGFPPIIGLNLETLRAPYADPLPQALILTAIVIGFGVFAFFLILTLKTYETNHSDDMDTLTEEL